MTPPLSLLAASDFSAHPRHAPARAAQLASAHPRAQLTLTHVISASVLSRLRGMVGGEGAHGAPTLRILGHAQSLDADLIVRGKHGVDARSCCSAASPDTFSPLERRYPDRQPRNLSAYR